MSRYGLRINHLCRFKRLALDRRAGIDQHVAILDRYGKQVERARGGRVFDRALHIEFGAVAGADEFVLVGIPGHGAAEMRAAVIDGQQATVTDWRGTFTEEFDRHAFDRTLQLRSAATDEVRQVKFLFNHGMHPMISNMPIGQIRTLISKAREMGEF